ncbi:WxL protein peptidoglycan domain-containing protein [Solirubrobacter ginsenosidimutans]|uniref:WxL protein peptidoglycan domain-containing protein n=1 Tax=Solirubrobacter ginsenosidimutans TaxID=490573 RepID=UPI0022CDF761|nr:DUF916 domain-containing protein [Solirubrobacter ginsenosidimutans]
MATLGLVGCFARPAAAAEWTVKTAANQFGDGRQDFRYTVNPGGTVEDGIVVENPGTTPLHLALYGADAFTTAAGKLDLRAADAKATGVGVWAQPSQADVTVPANGSVEVPFAITLPKDAKPGDYVGGIVTADADQRVPIQIRLRVGGALKPSLAVEGVRVDYSGSANPLAKGDATVTYAIHNTGNTILTAQQAVKVSGPFGRWAVRAPKVADTPTLLPGETWKASASLDDVAPALRLTASVTLVPLLTDAAGSTAPLAAIKASGHAWIVPWALLVAILVLLGLVVAALAYRRAGASRARVA